jgi:hypothetical protein
MNKILSEKTSYWKRCWEPMDFWTRYQFTVNNSGLAQFEDLFNSDDNYAFGGVPLYISAETNIANKWTAKAVLSSNRWKDGKSL